MQGLQKTLCSAGNLIYLWFIMSIFNSSQVIPDFLVTTFNFFTLIIQSTKIKTEATTTTPPPPVPMATPIAVEG